MTEPAAPDDDPIIEVEDFSFFYGSKQVLFNIGMTFETNRVTALIGPSGCGKSTLLRNINRMNDLVPDVRHQGDIRIDGTSLYDPRVEVISLRKRVGMVFQKYNPFPKSIYENIVFPLRVAGRSRRAELDETVERSLKGAALWDEVKDKLHESAYGLSGGQQQRLCIARAIANRPQILLMDEPCAALDPIATLKIEDLMEDLKKDLTIVIVTHNMQQATRIADVYKRQAGKVTKKKSLAEIAMSYGYVYVAQVAMGANPAQTLKAIHEAEAYDGPSLIIGYSPCEMHSIKKGGMQNCQAEMKKAVECGYWNLFRFNPEAAAGKKFSLDSKEPAGGYQEFLMNEARYASLTRSFPERAEELFKENEQAAMDRYQHLLKLKTVYNEA